MRSASRTGDAVLLSLFAGLGLLPQAVHEVPAVDCISAMPATSPELIVRSDRPESPPPKL